MVIKFFPKNKIHKKVAYFNPWQECSNSYRIIKQRLSICQRLKLKILIRVLQEHVQHLVNLNYSVNVEANAQIAHEQNDYIEHVPYFFEVFQFVYFDLVILKQALRQK